MQHKEILNKREVDKLPTPPLLILKFVQKTKSTNSQEFLCFNELKQEKKLGGNIGFSLYAIF